MMTQFNSNSHNNLLTYQYFSFHISDNFLAFNRDELTQRRNKIVRKIIIRTQGSLYAKGWTTWVNIALKMKKHDLIVRKCAAKMRYRAATLCLTAWRSHVATEKKHRRIVAAAVYRIKNRVIIGAFVTWKTDVARVVRNRRVLKLHLERRDRMHVHAHLSSWYAYFNIGRRTRTQLKRVWRLKRARFLKLYWQEWMGKVATRCTVCHRESRPVYQKSPPKLKHVHDWTKRESGWDHKVHKIDIPDFLKQLPPIKGSPPKSLHMQLLKRPSPEEMVGNRTVGQLKKIIDRAGKLRTMTAKARLELETSNRVLDGFVNDLMQSDILSEETRAELETMVTGDAEEQDSNSPKALDRARNMKAFRGNEPGRNEPGGKLDLEDSSRPVVLSHPRTFSREEQANLKRRSPKKKKTKKNNKKKRSHHPAAGKVEETSSLDLL